MVLSPRLIAVLLIYGQSEAWFRFRFAATRNFLAGLAKGVPVLEGCGLQLRYLFCVLSASYIALSRSQSVFLLTDCVVLKMHRLLCFTKPYAGEPFV